MHGDHGLYAIVDQQLWKGSGAASINAFTRISVAPERQNLIDLYFDAGIVFTGLIPARPKDFFGFAYGYAGISDRVKESQRAAGEPVIASYEAVLEANYTAEIMSGWTIVPDFQYFWNPGGHIEDPSRPGEAVKDAAVFGVRTNISY